MAFSLVCPHCRAVLKSAAPVPAGKKVNFLEYELRADGKMKLQNFNTGIKLDLVYQSIGRNAIEIKGDTAGNNTLNGQPYPMRRLEVRVTGNELHVRETFPENEPDGFTLKKAG
jgi:hypothetical protein